jgi:hypothetical protein
MKTLVIGDTSEDLASFAWSLDKQSKLLLTIQHYDETQTGYTSLGDVDLQVFHTLVSLSDRVILHFPHSVWSTDDLKNTTIHQLRLWQNIKPIENLPIRSQDWPDYLEPLIDRRKTEDPQIWIAGCSIPNGNGVNHDQRFGYLLSQRLRCAVSHLTLNGSSLAWASDQVLRSDIRQGDLLIFGLTSISRFSWVNHQGTHRINALVSEKEMPDRDSREIVCSLFGSLHQDILSINAVRQVQAFCDRIDCKIVLADFFPFNMEDYLAGSPTYLHLLPCKGQDRRFLDYANDGRHPGPLTHQWFSDTLYDYLNP